MKHLFLMFWLFIFVDTAALPALMAQEYEADSQAGNMIFYMPRGWKRVDNPQATVIAAPLTTPQQAFIALLPAADLKTDLRAAYDARWAELQSGYKVLQKSEVVSKHAPKGYDLLASTAVLADSKGMRWALFLMVAQNGTHAETVAFMSNVGDPGLSNTLQEVLGHFLDSLGFSGGAGDARVAEAAKPIPLTRGKGKFNGIYRGMGAVHYTNGGASISWRYVVFFSDGRFMEGFPDWGMDKLDEDAEIRRNPVGWGSYQSSGGPDGHGKIVFLITDPEQEKEPIVWDLKEYPDHLQVNGDTYNRLEPCDGMKLEGTFRRADYKTLYAGSRQGITFTPDGRFSDEGVFKAAAVMVRQPVGNGYDFDDGAPGSGTYRIANYTLELTYSNGRVKRTSIFLEPGASKTGVREFYLNTYKFARVQ
jgi:hypothetical protein